MMLRVAKNNNKTSPPEGPKPSLIDNATGVFHAGSCQSRSCFLQWLLIWFLLFLVFSGLPVSVYAERTVFLEIKEHEWLDEHPVIRIGMDADYAPYSFRAADGSYQGVAPDLVKRIGKMLGVHFEIGPDQDWPGILKAAQERSVDTIATAVRTPERESYLNFTRIYIPTPLVIMARKDDQRVSSPADLSGMKVALVKDYSSTKKVLSEYPSIQQYQAENSLEGLRAVATGKADAFVGVLGVSTFLASKHGILNLKVAAPYEMALNGQRIAVRKDWPELVTILDKSIQAIPDDEKIRILNKWIPIDSEYAKIPKLRLTDQEKSWLSQHRELRLAIDPDFAPVEFVDEQGMHAGISADYVNVLSKKLGIKMKVVHGISWSFYPQRFSYHLRSEQYDTDENCGGKGLLCS